MSLAASAHSEANARRRDLLVLVCTSAPSFMLQLDANIVSVSLPAIARTLHASFAGIEWVITVYMLSFASLLLPAGALADRFGRKKLLIIGLTVFTLASLGCGLASSLNVLIAARTMQGAGAAMQLSAALATLSHEFQGAARARAFAFWGAVVGIGMAIGPVIGGLITQVWGWQWAFYVNLPIGVLLILLIRHVLQSSRDPHAMRLDLPGVICFGGALFLATLALIEGNHRGWSDDWIVGELVAALVLFCAFIQVERAQRRPMLDLAFFRRATYLGANLAQLSFSAGMLTLLTFLPIFLQSGLGHPAGEAGLMMLPLVLPLFVVPRLVSKHLAHRLSGRSLLVLGLLLVCVGHACFAATIRSLAYVPLVAGMLVTGLGAGLLNGETTKVGMSLVPKERSGMASGVSGTVRFSGLVLGIAALGAVLYTRVGQAITLAVTDLGVSERGQLVREITAGNLAGVRLVGRSAAQSTMVALESLASGYQALFMAGAAFMLVSAVLTWWLIDPRDTPPVKLQEASPAPQSRERHL